MTDPPDRPEARAVDVRITVHKRRIIRPVYGARPDPLEARLLLIDGGKDCPEAPQAASGAAISERQLQEIAVRIRERVRRWTKDVVFIGAQLIVVKARLRHGDFQRWVTDDCQMSPRSAQNYMNAAMLARKSETVSRLPPNALYRLAAPSTPAAVKTRVITDLVAGREVDIRQIELWIGQEREMEARLMAEPKHRAEERQRDRARIEARIHTRVPEERQKRAQAAAAEAWAIVRASLSKDDLARVRAIVQDTNARWSFLLLLVDEESA